MPLVDTLKKIDGQHSAALVVQHVSRKALLLATSGGIWRVHPNVTDAVADAMKAYNAGRAPLRPLDSAQLGPDGGLIEQQIEGPDLAKALEKAVRTFDPHAPTIDERDMACEWEASLKHRLTAAEAAFCLHHRGRTGEQITAVEPPSPLALAPAARGKRPRGGSNPGLLSRPAATDAAVLD